MTEARLIAEDMQRNLGLARWNLAARRAQEVVELSCKGLLNEMGLEQVRTHDAAERLIGALRERGLEPDDEFLKWFVSMSARLAELRAPAFYHEIAVSGSESEIAAEAASRILEFAGKTLKTLRNSPPDASQEL